MSLNNLIFTIFKKTAKPFRVYQITERIFFSKLSWDLDSFGVCLVSLIMEPLMVDGIKNLKVAYIRSYIHVTRISRSQSEI